MNIPSLIVPAADYTFCPVDLFTVHFVPSNFNNEILKRHTHGQADRQTHARTHWQVIQVIM